MHSIEKKRRIVEETFRPHASVARVAQAHGVNANQVFYWRKQYQQGLLGPTKPKAALLPVQIADLVPLEPMPTAVETNEVRMAVPPRAEAKPTGAIHLELAKAKLCIDGVADLACLRTILDCLLG
jgi:transposase